MRVFGTLASAVMRARQRPPVPMRPMLMRSLAPSGCADAGSARAEAAAKADVATKERRVVDMRFSPDLVNIAFRQALLKLAWRFCGSRARNRQASFDYAMGNSDRRLTSYARPTAFPARACRRARRNTPMACRRFLPESS